MGIYSFGGNDLKMMLRGAVELLGQSKEQIDALNVFPVPDGDTGTNMHKTLVSAVKEAEAAKTDHIGLVARAAAKGCLFGARGNSGVILSQFLHGFALSLDGKEVAFASDLTRALQEGAEVAYQAVMRPVEGTILTVVRESAKGAETAAQRSDDLLRIMICTLKMAFLALRDTPDQLPLLKQTGVVDAGGKGFVVILEGILRSLKNASPYAKNTLFAQAPPLSARERPTLISEAPAVAKETINFTYCTELLIKGKDLPFETVKEELNPFGDCLMVVGEQTLAKVHIHTDHPGTVLESCLKYGTLHDIKINNMLEQQQEMADKQQFAAAPGALAAPAKDKLFETALPDQKPFAVVGVASGTGLVEIMKNLGADIILDGGQTLNPSAGEILKAVEEAPSQQVIVLPNNKNVIHAAKQAGDISRKKVVVLPSKSIPQGLAALLSLCPGDKFETVEKKMAGALGQVNTGEITRAVRDTNYNHLAIRKGNFIGLLNGDLKVHGTDLAQVLDDLLSLSLDRDGSLITIYYGEQVARENAQKIAQRMRRKYPRQEFDLQYGGQPVYDLIISIE